MSNHVHLPHEFSHNSSLHIRVIYLLRVLCHRRRLLLFTHLESRHPKLESRVPELILTPRVLDLSSNTPL